MSRCPVCGSEAGSGHACATRFLDPTRLLARQLETAEKKERARTIEECLEAARAELLGTAYLDRVLARIRALARKEGEG